MLESTPQTRMFEGLDEATEAHALEAFPGEAVGAVFGSRDRPVYRPVREVADGSRAGFRVEAGVLRRMEEAHGALLALVHTRSSTRGEGKDADPLLFIPSPAEMRAQAALAVPFGVVVCNRSRCVDRFWFGDQCPTLPLVGRPFRYGVTDCYSLVRDWYRTQRGVLLPDYPREWNWWVEGLDMYGTGFGEAGFHRIEPADAGEGDSVLFRIRSKVPNHAAVLLGGGWMLHHTASRRPYDVMWLSRRERLERWEPFASHWLRYEGGGKRHRTVAGSAGSCPP